MTFVLGLTGSIGMGKSTTAAMFARRGIPVWDADAAVHRLYATGGAAALALAPAFPQAIDPDGSVSRPHLRKALAQDPAALDRLNAIVHPLVAADRDAFLAAHLADAIVLLDVPLLFENGIDTLCDGVAVVSVPPEVQRARVLARGTLTPGQFDLLLSRQMPDAAKRARATWVIDTGTLDSAEAAVSAILDQIARQAGQEPHHA